MFQHTRDDRAASMKNALDIHVETAIEIFFRHFEGRLKDVRATGKDSVKRISLG